MKLKKNTLRVVRLLAAGMSLALSGSCIGWAQHPTAVQRLQLSGFGGVSGDFTGLEGGKNFAVTAGADLGLPSYHGLRPTIELRGTYPTDRGLIDAQRSVLGGLRVDLLVSHRIHPYVDFLAGRGEMTYGYGYFYNNYEYDLTTTYVYSPGGGFDYDLTDHFAVKVDGQYQRWGSAPTASGTIYSSVGTVAVVYRFDFNRGH